MKRIAISLVISTGCSNAGEFVGSTDAQAPDTTATSPEAGAAPVDAGAPSDGIAPSPDALAPADDAARPDAAPPPHDATGPGPDAAPLPIRCEPCAAPHAAITGGLQRVHFDQLMSRVSADPARYVPLVWASPEATGGDRQGLAGTLPAPGWLGLVGQGRVVVWAGHEGAFTGANDGRDDNDTFRARLFDWLRGAGTRVGFSASHGEWLGADALSPAVRGALEANGVQIGPLPGVLDAAALATVDVLVVGNPWGDVTEAELDAISTWVTQGGAVLVLGLGWSWRGNHDDPTAERYPVQRLGARLGFDVRGGAIFDPGAPAGTADLPAYDVRPLDAYRPLEVVVLRGEEASRVADHARARPEAMYVIEGHRMGLSLPNGDWSELRDPQAALAALDRVYEAEMSLVSGIHPPFDGDLVWIIGVDAPDEPWWMHSGNPIVYQAPAARAEIIPRLNDEGQPGWGVAHEQGHNMHGGSCGDLFVPSGTVEVWPNVFGLFSYRENGWDWAPQMGADLFAAGRAHHAGPDHTFAELTADPFILLGCLDVIIERYGWEGMRTFLTGAATEAANGLQAGDDAARVAYLVERLSQAYRVDLAPVLAHWGFPVSEVSRAITANLPEADLPR